MVIAASLWVWGLGIGMLLLGAIAVFAIPLARRWRAREVRQALRMFRCQREQLEAKFLDLAQVSGKPRGLRWVDCDWQNSTTFARDRQSGLLTAFAGINIRFEAIEGGDMEDVAAVGTIRDAVAVFHFHRGRWGTGGKALFNMNADDAITRLTAQFEPVSAEKPW